MARSILTTRLRRLLRVVRSLSPPVLIIIRLPIMVMGVVGMGMGMGIPGTARLGPVGRFDMVGDYRRHIGTVPIPKTSGVWVNNDDE